MGHVHVMVRLKGSRTVSLKMLVDTGATYCLVSPDIARRAGLDPNRRSVTVRLADGRRIKYGADAGVIRIDGREAGAFVLVGAADEPILGVEALEALGMDVDLKKRRLRKTRGYSVRLG